MIAKWLGGVALLSSLACGYALDLGAKEGGSLPPSPPERAEIAAQWPLAAGLCDTGRQTIHFTAADQRLVFPVALSVGAELLVVADGSPRLDTTLAVYGPQRLDGGFDAVPAASSDDSAGGRSAAITWRVPDTAGVYLVVASTFQGLGRGTATITLAVDGDLGCPVCPTASSSRPLAGCVEPANSDVIACATEGDDWAALSQTVAALRAADPCASLPDDLWCRLKASELGPEWPGEWRKRIELANHLAGGLPAGQLEALEALALEEPNRVLSIVRSVEGDRVGEVRLGLEVETSAEPLVAAAAVEHRLGPILGALAALPLDYTLDSRWTQLAGGGVIGRYFPASYRGLPIEDRDTSVLEVRLAPSQCPGRMTLESVVVWGLDVTVGADVDRDCPAGTWRCASSGVCFDASAALEGRQGYDYCVSCLQLAPEECACWTAAGPRADGSGCWLGAPLPVSGLCDRGRCVADSDGERCAGFGVAIDSVLAQPEYRTCLADSDCSVLGGARSCEERPGFGVDAGGAVNPEGLTVLTKYVERAQSAGCAGWRRLWLPARVTSRTTASAACQGGRCDAGREVCP